MIAYYADVMPDGSVRACIPYASPPAPDWASQAQGTAVPLDAPINWTGPTPTSALHMVNGALTWVETATLDQLKAAKLAELADAFTQRIAAVRAGYPDDEVKSWPEQKAEASAFTADATATVPLLSNMATARGITVANLAARVLANAAAWASTSGALIGKRQKYEDAVSAATDAPAVAAIVWTD